MANIIAFVATEWDQPTAAWVATFTKLMPIAFVVEASLGIIVASLSFLSYLIVTSLG